MPPSGFRTPNALISLPSLRYQLPVVSGMCVEAKDLALISLGFRSMPLYHGAPGLIRANLEALSCGKRVSLVAIGRLTDSQLQAIDKNRQACGYPAIRAEIVFLGRHVYEGRAVKDGYSIDDILHQMARGLDAASVVLNFRPMTALRNPTPRPDRYGNRVRDQAVLECSARHPRPELFSVIPKGDTIKPKGRPPSVSGLDLSGSSGYHVLSGTPAAPASGLRRAD